MSYNIDIKKLSNLSKIEVPDSEINDTSKKIVQIINFFNKLDEFVIDGQTDIDYNNKIELQISSLRDDEPLIKKNLNGDTIENVFKFEFPHHKNGFVLGPRI